MNTKRLYLLLIASLMLTCKGSEEPAVIVPEDPTNQDPSTPDPEIPLPAPYTELTWEVADVELGNTTSSAGYQGKLARAADGALYYAYFKENGIAENTCDIALFSSSDPAPGVNYLLHVAVLPAGADEWQLETVPLDQINDEVPYVTSRYGLDSLVDSSGRLVLAFAGGAPSVGACGSGDLVLATRSAAGAWSLTTPVTTSASCCAYPDPCIDPACTSGDTVGAWAALAEGAGGALAVAYSDHHFGWDNDGISKRGLELLDGGAVTGIRPFSGKGTYAVMRYTAPRAGVEASGLVVAYTNYAKSGLFVARRVGTGGRLADWDEKPLRRNEIIGERPSLAVAPDGTLGLAFYLARNEQNQVKEDLVYCYSQDNGETWAVPCQTVDQINTVGQYPSLAFDKQSRPVISYYYCGAAGDCRAPGDGVRLAWRTEASAITTGVFVRRNVYFNAATKSGLYTGLVLDPNTDEPTITFQDITRGAAMVARGKLTGSAAP